MANHQSSLAGSPSLLQSTRVTGTGRNVVVEILDDSDTPVEDIDQDSGIATQPTASVSSPPHLLDQGQALQDELADIEAESAAYEADLATYQAKNKDHEAMSAKLDAEFAELEAKCDELEVRRRKLEADSAEYTAMRAEFDSKCDDHNARSEQLAAACADLKMRHASYTRRREIVRQSQSRINLSKSTDHGNRTLAHSQANVERPAQPSLRSQQGSPQFQRIRAEVRDVIAAPGETLQQLGFAPIPSTESMVPSGGLNGDGPASNLNADGDSRMPLVPDSTSAEPQGPKKFDMPFQEESSSSTEYVPKTAKSAKRKPTKPRRPTQEERDYEMMDDIYKKPWRPE